MILLVIYVFIAVGFSFLCSIAEAVILSVPISYIVSLEQDGHRSGSILRELKENIANPLAIILTFNTVAHTLGAAGAGAQAVAVFGNVYFGVFSAILTLMILVISEIIPKALGAHYWRALAPPTGYCLHYLVKIFYPFVILSNLVTTLVVSKKHTSNVNRVEIAALAALGEEEGSLKKQESIALQNLVFLRDLKVKTILTPRTVLFSVSETCSVKSFMQEHANINYTRIPVYSKDNNMTGFVLRTDILVNEREGNHDRPLKELKRELHAILDEMSVLAALEQCLNKNMHILLVVDEYGDTKGIITMEDIFESLLGREIIDEDDKIADLQEYARRIGEIKRKKMSKENKGHL